MKNLITKLTILLFLFTLTSCGFKVINESEKNNFFIQKIEASGEKRINFKIKNNLLNFSKENSQNKLVIYLNSKKTKSIKEKNIKNEITKYQISLSVKIRFNLANNDKSYLIDLVNTGDYLVANSYSSTLNNEKKIVNDLVENMSERNSNI